MAAKRFTVPKNYRCIQDNLTKEHYLCEDKTEAINLAYLLNELSDENEQLRNRLKDWHQRTFRAHEYFNLLEKIIDEVCNDDIGNQIWAEYEKREKLIE